MTSEALRRVVVEYIKAVMQKRITFKNADERREGAERMINEAEQFKFLFRKLAAVSSHMMASLYYRKNPLEAVWAQLIWLVVVYRVKTQTGSVVPLLPLLRCSS